MHICVLTMSSSAESIAPRSKPRAQQLALGWVVWRQRVDPTKSPELPCFVRSASPIFPAAQRAVTNSSQSDARRALPGAPASRFTPYPGPQEPAASGGRRAVVGCP
jgi:hypothetical protein